MNIRPRLQLQTTLTAMRDVIVPAIDPANKVALEQAQLVIGMLVLLEKTLPLAYRYDRDELRRTLQLATTLQQSLADVEGEHSTLCELASSSAAAADVLDRAKADPFELEAAVGDLRAKIGALITEVYPRTHGSLQATVSGAVLASAKEQLIRERAWVVCQGWESDPSSLASIETVI